MLWMQRAQTLIRNWGEKWAQPPSITGRTYDGGIGSGLSYYSQPMVLKGSMSKRRERCRGDPGFQPGPRTLQHLHKCPR